MIRHVLPTHRTFSLHRTSQDFVFTHVLWVFGVQALYGYLQVVDVLLLFGSFFPLLFHLLF